MDIMTALVLAGGIVGLVLVVSLVVEHRQWKARRRLHTANWVLRAIDTCERASRAKVEP